eukprot:10105823-Prorocentrum_lima.AAC.1
MCSKKTAASMSLSPGHKMWWSRVAVGEGKYGSIAGSVPARARGMQNDTHIQGVGCEPVATTCVGA